MKKLTQAEIEVIRKKKIAQIKIAQNQLNLENDVYRALLTRVTGKDSAAQLNLKELDQVIDELVKQGFIIKSKTKQSRPKPRKELKAMIGKIEALLLDNNLHWDYARAIAKRQFGIDRIEWLSYEQCHSVVAALQIYADRQKKKVVDYDKLQDYEAYLPDTAKDIIDVIGLPDSIKLVRKYGGNTLLIPKFSRNGNTVNYISDVIGEAATLKLIKHFKGDRIYLPRCESALRKLRNDQFMKAVEDYVIEHKATQDQALFALCPKFGITYRCAFYILKNNKIEKRLEHVVQDRLFE